MSSAFRRGHTLDPRAVKRAVQHRKERLKYLLNQPLLALTPRERAEARKLTGRYDFWDVKAAGG
jgi:hypothetical protein